MARTGELEDTEHQLREFGDRMTIPEERLNSIVYTREFLYDLLDPKKTPRVPRDIRERARRCLRHYPADLYLERVAEKVPDDWKMTQEKQRSNT